MGADIVKSFAIMIISEATENMGCPKGKLE